MQRVCVPSRQGAVGVNFGEEARSQLYAVTDYLARRGNDQVLIPFRKSGWEFQVNVSYLPIPDAS